MVGLPQICAGSTTSVLPAAIKRRRVPRAARCGWSDPRCRNPGCAAAPDGPAPGPPPRRLSIHSEESGDGAVLDGDGRCVAGDHRGAAPAPGGLHGGGRRAAAYELRGQPPASGVRRDALEPQRCSQHLQAAVDLVRNERDDALGCGGLGRRAQVLDGAGEGAGEQPQVLATAVGVRLRGPDADPQLTRRQARRDSSCASAVSKCARVTSSPVASVLASRATSTTATASASSAPASVSVFTAACVSRAITGSVSPNGYLPWQVRYVTGAGTANPPIFGPSPA